MSKKTSILGYTMRARSIDHLGQPTSEPILLIDSNNLNDCKEYASDYIKSQNSNNLPLELQIFRHESFCHAVYGNEEEKIELIERLVSPYSEWEPVGSYKDEAKNKSRDEDADYMKAQLSSLKKELKTIKIILLTSISVMAFLCFLNLG